MRKKPLVKYKSSPYYQKIKAEIKKIKEPLRSVLTNYARKNYYQKLKTFSARLYDQSLAKKWTQTRYYQWMKQLLTGAKKMKLTITSPLHEYVLEKHPSLIAKNLQKTHNLDLAFKETIREMVKNGELTPMKQGEEYGYVSSDWSFVLPLS